MKKGQKCSTCPHLSKCKGKINLKQLTPQQRKNVIRLMQKAIVAKKLVKHKKIISYLTIGLLPLTVAYGVLMKAKVCKQIRILSNQMEDAMKFMKKALQRAKTGEGHSYISPERKTEQKKEKKSTTPIA